jgi:hypothetical protein
MRFASVPSIVSQFVADRAGNSLGTKMPVNLSPGTAASLDLNADTLALQRRRIEVQPLVSLTPPLAAGPPINSVCQASVEVFDHFTGRTWTYQASLFQLPAVQLPAAQ